MNKLLLATANGLVIGERDGDDWGETARGFAGRPVTSVIAREGVILAGTPDGVFRPHHAARPLAGLSPRHFRF